MLACVPFSSISRQRNARAIALTMALSIRRHTAAVVAAVPSGVFDAIVGERSAAV
jgi:hypothetical protein